MKIRTLPSGGKQKKTAPVFPGMTQSARAKDKAQSIELATASVSIQGAQHSASKLQNRLVEMCEDKVTRATVEYRSW